jgi:serine/threonine-protein kinase HipA
MILARRCGIRIPEVRIVTVGEKDVFLIRRFDREKGKSGWLRHGFLSVLSLMQWDERDRLHWDYPAIADIMRRYMTATDIGELYRRMIFNILVHNTDDHPRNHGVVSFLLHTTSCQRRRYLVWVPIFILQCQSESREEKLPLKMH